MLASGDERGVVRFTDLRTWKPIGAPVQLQRAVALQAMRFSPDGRTLAVGTRQSHRSELHLVDVTPQPAPDRLLGRARAGHHTITTSLAYAPDGRHLAVGLPTLDQANTTLAGQRLLLLDARSGRPLWRRHYPLRRGQGEAQLKFRSDGALISSAQRGETLVWDAAAGRIVRRYPIGGRFDLSPDGRRLALALNSPFAGDPDSSVALLDLRTGRHRKLASYLPERMDHHPRLHARRQADRQERLRRARTSGMSVRASSATRTRQPMGGEPAPCWIAEGWYSTPTTTAASGSGIRVARGASVTGSSSRRGRVAGRTRARWSIRGAR